MTNSQRRRGQSRTKRSMGGHRLLVQKGFQH